MSCDNVRENGHVAKVAVLGLAQARDPQLAAWIEENVTCPCTMVDRIFRRRRQKPCRKLLTSWVFTTRAPLPANRSVSG